MAIRNLPSPKLLWKLASTRNGWEKR